MSCFTQVLIVLSNPSHIPCRVIVLISLLMALRVVVTVWGESGRQLDFGQMGRVGKEPCDTLGVSVWDILMLNITGVIVVLPIGVDAEVRMFQSMNVSCVAASSRDKIVELVGHVGWIVN
jgi:hypothetical protein